MSTPKVCPYCGGHVGAKLTECPSCHTPLRWAMDDALPEGTVLAGRYLIIRTLSQDGEGYFYAAKERSSELSVVIKEYFPLTLSAPRLQNGGIEAKMGREVPFKTLRMDFEELYTTLQQITPATGLTAVLDLVRENGTTYAVLEPARGQTLSQYLRGKRPLRPAEVRSMYKGNLPKSAALGRNEVAVYRLVRQGGYTVLMLCDDVNWTPTVGASYELLVESFDNTRVSATVESVTRSEGELLVRLSVVGDVSPVLYIRSCHVQLSESIYSLTVPANAITTVDGEMGVVVVQPDGNYFLPVTIISQDSNEAHIVPQLSNILSVGSVVLVF